MRRELEKKKENIRLKKGEESSFHPLEKSFEMTMDKNTIECTPSI